MTKCGWFLVLGSACASLLALAPVQASVMVYANTTNGPLAAYAQAPGTQIGDDLLMTQGGTLDWFGFSVFNGSSSDGNLVTADLTIDFWNLSGGGKSQAGTVVLDDVGFGAGGMAPGMWTSLLVPDVSSSQTITLTDDVLAVLTIDDVTGGATRVGQVLIDPPTVGSSSNAFYKNDTGIGGSSDGWFWFGGDPVANFYWSVGVIPAPVPEPASLLLLGAGLVGLLALRVRQRK